MLAYVIVGALVGVIVYFQIFKQGLFSALINAVLTIVAALVALNYFELLATKLVGAGLANFAPQTISLVLIFAITLLILRLLCDRLIRGNMNFSLAINRGGSAICGFITAMVTVGIIALGFQLAPIGPKFLYFDRCPKLNDPEKDNSLFPSPDAFTLAIMDNVAKYSFAGKTSFKRTHPDFLRELYMNRIALDPGSRSEAASDAVKIKKAWLINADIAEVVREKKELKKTGNTLVPASRQCFIAISTIIQPGSNDDSDRGARDVDGVIRFVCANFRLVGFHDTNATKPGIQRYPIAILKKNQKGLAAERIALDGAPHGEMLKQVNAKNRPVEVDFLFEWPSDIKKQPPQFLEFKRSAYAEMPTAKQLLGQQN